ncbi:MAG: nucleoside 2-deoxyribosyltransferase [Bacteroidota bacterium]
MPRLSTIKRVYLAISLSNRGSLENELVQIQEVFEEKGSEVFIFVDHYHFQKEQEKEMMKAAFQEIDRSDLLIAELSKKAIGVGIELGYARAKGIPILYLRQKGREHSTTASGSSDFHLIYENPRDLGQQLQQLLSEHL